MSEKIINFDEELEKSLQNIQEPVAGSLLEGKVVSIMNSEAFVDIGWTQEIAIPLDEFDTKPSEMDKVYIYCYKDKLDRTMFSKKRADEITRKNEIANCLREGLPIKGIVKKYNKDRKIFEIDLNGIKGICYADKIDFKDISDDKSNDYIEKEFEFKVVSYRNNRVVVSRKDFLYDHARIEKIKFFKEKTKDEIISCKVSKILENGKGALVSLGAFEGFIPRKEISYSRYFEPGDILSEGEVIKCKIIELNKKADKIIFSFRQAHDDPWDSLKYEPDQVVKCIVKKAFPDGIFVQVDDGVDGYISRRDFSWTGDPEAEKFATKEGNVVEAKILKIDEKNRKLILGIKHILPNPWDSFVKENQAGKKLKGKIKKVTDFGIFVELDKGIDGLLRKQELSWTEFIDPVKEYSEKIGQEIEVVIKDIDKEKRKIGLSIKELFDNPWENLQANSRVGSNIEVLVSEIEEKKLIVKVSEEISGIIPISEVAQEKVFNLSERYNIGDKIIAKIKILDPQRKKLTLSIKDFITEEQNKELGKFLFDKNDTKMTLGDLLKK